MKNKLLLILLLISSFSFAQLPTDEISRYLFTSGSLINEINPGVEDLVRAGTAGVSSVDRLLTAGDSQLLNGDYLTRGNYNSTNSSLSFWVKTTTNDAVKRTVFDKSVRTGSGFGTFETGFFIHLQDGKIGIDGSYVQSNAPGGANTQNSFSYTNTTNIDDGNWHHIVITNRRTYPEVGNYANAHYLLTYYFNIYIDGVAESFQKNNQNSFSIDNPLNVNQNLTVANKATLPQLLSTDVYLDEIDDIYVYERVLTTPEVVSIRDNGGFCVPPDASDFSVTNINSGQATIILPAASNSTYEAAIVESGMPFNTAVFTSNLYGVNGIIPGLLANKTYDLYLRKDCQAPGVWSNWSNAITFSTPTSIIYVDSGASGINDGSSWTNAYTTVNAAFAAATQMSEIWVKGGVYNPDVFDTSISFTLTVNNVGVYGGFAGTETSLSNRVLGTNPTILSGDLFANDNSTLSYNNTSRSDNSINVLKVDADNVIIDGFTVSGGEGVNGAGIIKNVEADGFVLRNMIIENNVAVNSAAGFQCQLNRTGDVKIENSIFRNNLSTYYAGAYFYFGKSSSTSGTVYINNTLFEGNKIEDEPNRPGASGPALGYYGTNGGVLNMRINNCTFVNNTDSGTLATADRGVVVGGRYNGGLPPDLDISNSIFWNNTRNASILDEYGTSTFYGAGYTNVDNTIGQGNLNTITADPLFTNSALSDYTLQGNSPAADAGDNTKVENDIVTDLAGNRRIIGTTVDMGAYELTRNCNELFNYKFTSVSGSPGTAILTWLHPFNPSGPFDLIYVTSGQPMGNGTTVSSLTTQSHTITGLNDGFYDVYIRAYCNGTPAAYVMQTIGFNTPWFVDLNATGTSIGKNWVNAFTTIQEALAVAQSGDKIWVAQGIYKPTAGSRSNTFNFNIDNLEVYGGFDGTETDISQRNHLINETILSGDINDNDTALGFSEANRAENNYHVITINGNDILVNGIAVSGGQANATSGNDGAGAGIFIASTAVNLVVDKCVFRNNVAIGGASIYTRPNTTTMLTVNSSQFYNNMGNYGVGVYVINDGAITHDVEISNSLFYNNESRNRNGADGFTGSAIWLRANTASSTLTSNISNCTFTGNSDIGTRASTQRGAVSLSRNSGATHTSAVSNSVFFNNTGAGGVTTPALTKGHSTFITSVLVSNSIDPDNFSTLPPSFKVNVSTADPLFLNAATNDYTLSSSSPAIDAGDNTYVIGSTDLSGAARIFNTNVDMGAYEYVTTLGVGDFEFYKKEIKLYPNPTTSVLNIKMKSNLKQATIYSVLGTEVLKITSKTINTSNLQSGMYLIKIENETGSVTTKRFIKQ
ncbi:choice-of-anchor Q domain-containing protein [Lacinutrix sp. Bg11-31]|uniref:choice-of-anchor Q domain-containing protein n=1 Tax=Lacinutrix sp. Bg11-31 TaxID=2057808 RepID=UPI000C31A259|nr:choice-of-anchor Q domain-containing protein [Lacinutrix sp. Bg11-31]AUC83473.1 hypothetical protein CW733_15570 [Lacinutrix sp. Bg11-31]